MKWIKNKKPKHKDPITVASIHIVEDPTWVRSEFPHPLVTLDFDVNDKLVAVTVAGKSLDVSTYHSKLDPEDTCMERLAKALRQRDREAR